MIIKLKAENRIATTSREIDIEEGEPYVEFTGEDAAVLRLAGKKLITSKGQALLVFFDRNAVRAIVTV
jgi:hypothetical protein